MSRPVSAMIERASSALTPGISASRWAAGSTAASVPVPALGPVLPSASTPQAARIWARCSSIRAARAAMRVSQKAIWSSSICASSPW